MFKLRNLPMTDSQRADIGEAVLQAMIQEINKYDLIQNCTNCHHWLNHKCDLFNAVPPPYVIVKGCEHYKDDYEIPF